MRVKALAGVALLLVGFFGQRWFRLAWNAWDYPVAPPTARTQLVVVGDYAYVAAGTDGIEVVNLASRRSVGLVPPPAPGDRVDDLAVADGWLFALDATVPGHLTAFSLADPTRPAVTGPAEPVPVGPFSGVSAATGLVVVSGGTSSLTLRTYDERGRFGTELATGDFGRGQPDAALAPDGGFVAISTHTFGPDFALTLVELRRDPLTLAAASRVDLPRAGFTAGGFKPAHFPLVSAWQVPFLYVADGGGLTVIDVADPRRPRVVFTDSTAAPALDVVARADELDVLRGGSHPAVLRYRLAGTTSPTLVTWSTLPPDFVPAAFVRHGANLVVTARDQHWRVLTPTDFPLRPVSP